LTIASLADRLADLPLMTDRLGASAAWRVREVGDGNLNLVFIVESDRGSLVVKQALPYVRVFGEGWPMSRERAFFEYHAMTRLGQRDPGRMPQLLHFDASQSMQVMEHLSPHLILRGELIAGRSFEHLALHLGHYLARTLFRGSDLSMATADRKADLALFAANVELSGITEDLFFTDPFWACPRNRHTPALDADVARLRADTELKRAAIELKRRFCMSAETLLHGDLHTGSIMVSDRDTRVIDAEFAIYGPMGFDIGSLLGNLWMTACVDCSDWIMAVAEAIWATFVDEFTRLWSTERTGILGARELFEDQGDAAGAQATLRTMLDEIWQDTLGFAGLEMHRRILGFAHVADFEGIEDESRRASLERKALAIGRELAVGRDRFLTIGQVSDLVRLNAGRSRS
jgi:5-methylthioribose kinase